MSVVARIRLYVPQNQEQMLYLFIGVSFLVHLIFLILGQWNLFSDPRNLRSEWAMETDLVADSDLASNRSSLPNAKFANKVRVPSNLLPQINKDFAIQEKKRQEEGLIPAKSDKSLEKGSNQTENLDKQGIDDPDRAATRLRKLEALKRLAMERLRKQQKERSNTYQAEESSQMPKLKANLEGSNASKKTLGGGILSEMEAQRYVAYLTKVVRMNWFLPNTYQLKKSDVASGLHVIINARGELISVKVNRGSGDDIFDQYCIEAVKKSAPFKAPPVDRAGDVFRINCRP